MNTHRSLPLCLPTPEETWKDGFEASFKAPGAAWRGKPFWSWNGKLDRAELLRQVSVMKTMGFGGYFMHSRTGLVTEYLGDEWFDLINACADEGEKLGLEAWLYDEDRWPSGLAGGLVTEDPAHRMKFLNLTVVEGSAYAPPEGLIAAFVAEGLDGVRLASFKPLPLGERPGADAKVLVFHQVEMQKHSFYNGYTYVDTLSRAATDRFIALTHEKYAEKCGDRLGRSIKGIFTDEPHRGTLMSTFGRHGGDWAVPFSPGLLAAYQKTWGEDLVPVLPHLFLQVGGVAHHPVKWRYVELLQQTFLKNYAEPCQDWCRNHGIALTGHILHEDTLTAQVAMSGSVMRYYAHMDAPGIDILSEGNRQYWVAKQLQSAARQVGKPWLLSELYGCTGWQMGLSGHKAVGDWQALFGINLRCHHLSWYTMEGEAKRDYPASMLHQSPWYKDYDGVEAYYGRLGQVLSKGAPVCETLVINPVESLWTRFYPGWCQGLTAADPVVKTLEDQYAKTFHWLQEGQVDFDYGDEGMMQGMASVVQDGKNPPRVKVGLAEYRQVVVAGALSLRASTLELLKNFQAVGGRVLFAGEAPTLIEGAVDSRLAALVQKGEAVAFDRVSLVTACRKGLSAPYRLLQAGGAESTWPIFSQIREDDAGTWIVLMNMDREKATPPLTVTSTRKGVVEVWDCRTGMKSTLARYPEGLTIPLELPAMGEIVYRILPETTPVPKDIPIHKASHPSAAPVTLYGPFAWRKDEPNVLVLDFARFKTTGDWQAADEILQVDRNVRTHFGLPHRAGDMIQPWYAARSKIPDQGPLTLEYRFQVSAMPQDEITLVLENGAAWAVEVNGHPLPTTGEAPWWIDVAFRKFTIPKAHVATGVNTITLAANFKADMNLEAIYLLGDFGVDAGTSPCSVVALPRSLSTGGLAGQSLPFYSGSVTYVLDDARLSMGGRLRIPDFGGSLVKLDGRPCHFPPYQFEVAPGKTRHELEVVLTRRNTFGPLHQVPLYPSHYGPASFVTKGDGFTPSYQLVPTGLTGSLVWEPA